MSILKSLTPRITYWTCVQLLRQPQKAESGRREASSSYGRFASSQLVLGELCNPLAFEKLPNIEVFEHAKWIRTMFSEITCILSRTSFPLLHQRPSNQLSN